MIRIRSFEKGGDMMKIRLLLSDLVDAYDMSDPEAVFFIDKRTGKIVFHINEDYVNDPENERLGKELEENPENFIAIPEKESREEYMWMKWFTESVADENLKEKLFIALDGRGAFRRFKNVLYGYPDDRKQWFAYREERIKEKLLEWCKAEGIECIEIEKNT